MEFARQKWLAAKRSYEAGLKIALDTAAMHPITISLYYSLGCVEYEQGKDGPAKYAPHVDYVAVACADNTKDVPGQSHDDRTNT